MNAALHFFEREDIDDETKATKIRLFYLFMIPSGDRYDVSISVLTFCFLLLAYLFAGLILLSQRLDSLTNLKTTAKKLRFLPSVLILIGCVIDLDNFFESGYHLVSCAIHLIGLLLSMYAAVMPPKQPKGGNHYLSICAVCGVCEETVGWNRYKLSLDQSWCCSSCLKKACQAACYTINVHQVGVHDLQKLIHGGLQAFQTDTEYRKRCNVCGHVFCYHDSGVITQEEFDAKKKQLLGL